MRSRLGIKACLAAFALLQVLTGLASAQGIHNITLRANANPFPGHHRYANVWGDGNFAYVGSYDANGVLIFDITNPDAPVLAANYSYSVSQPICGTNCDNQLEDVEVQNGIGFFASNNLGGIHIVDLSNPYNPKLITRITSAIGGWDSVHTILVSGNYMYVPHYMVDNLMQVWDISNPASPVLKWTFQTTDPLSIRASSFLNNTLYTSGRGGHTDIWDVSNIANQPPVLLGTILSGQLSHSSSPTPDGNYLVSSRELNANGGDVRIFNVSNPANPTQVSIITMPSYGIESVSPHNPMVMGNLLYHSWYDAGLVVFDITDRANPIMVGNYDTWTGPITIGQYDGDWGIYPYLGQNEVLISDQDSGLYILDCTGVNSNPVLFNFLINPPPNASSGPLTHAAPSVTGSTTASGKAFLMGVAGSTNLTVALSATGPASPSGNIVIRSGMHRNNGNINTSPVANSTTAKVTASYNGNNVSATMNVIPPALSSFSVSPANVASGSNTTGTVTLNGTTAVDTPVALGVVSGGDAIASMPSSVTVTAGTSSATFQISTNSGSTTSVTISATLNSTTLNASFTVGATALSSVTFTPTPSLGGGNVTGQVNFSAPVSADTQVNLSIVSGAGAVSSMPSSVTVANGNSSATFPITTAQVTSSTTVQISASAGGGSVQGNLGVVPPATPKAVKFSVNPLLGGNGTTVTVTATSAVSIASTVNLNVVSGAGAVASLPSSVVIPAGQTSASCQIVTSVVTSSTAIQISASTYMGTANGTLTVTPPVPMSVVFLTNPISGGNTTQVRVVMQKAVAASTTVNLSVLSGAAAVNSIPSSVVVQQGHNTVVFNMSTNTVSTQTTVQVQASANGGSATGTETVNP